MKTRQSLALSIFSIVLHIGFFLCGAGPLREKHPIISGIIGSFTGFALFVSGAMLITVTPVTIPIVSVCASLVGAVVSIVGLVLFCKS